MTEGPDGPWGHGRRVLGVPPFPPSCFVGRALTINNGRSQEKGNTHHHPPTPSGKRNYEGVVSIKKIHIYEYIQTYIDIYQLPEWMRSSLCNEMVF